MRQPYLYNYIGVKPCGCVVAMCVDMGDKRTATFVAEFIRDGLHVERVLVEDAVKRFKRCTHQPRQPEAPAMQQAMEFIK